MTEETRNDRTVLFGIRRGGLRGAFTQLMTENPDIREQLVRQYVMSNRYGQPKIALAEIHRLFIRALRMKGITDSYPFNTLDCGYRALCRYLRSQDKSLTTKRRVRARTANLDGDAQRQKSTADD